jgi:hypothetical protein
MQAVLAARHMAKPAVDPGLLGLGAVALAGGAVIAASFAFGITSGLYVDVKAWEWSSHLGGGPLVIIAAALAGLAWWLGASRNQPAFLAFAERIHAEGRDLFGPQHLALTDDGILCVNGTGRHFVRWGALTGLVLEQGVWYAIIQGGAAIWIPEATIRATEDPDGLRAFIRRKAGTLLQA